MEIRTLRQIVESRFELLQQTRASITKAFGESEAGKDLANYIENEHRWLSYRIIEALAFEENAKELNSLPRDSMDFTLIHLFFADDLTEREKRATRWLLEVGYPPVVEYHEKYGYLKNWEE